MPIRSFLCARNREAGIRDWFIERLAEDVWIGHTPQFQQWAGENERIVRVAREAGFEKQIIETVPDRQRRPVFEIFRFDQPRGSGRSDRDVS